MSMENWDHGGGIDAAAAVFGGARADWLDLSTGINPAAYPLSRISHDAWTALPDQAALARLTLAARTFWNVPPEAAVLAVPGASAAIAQIPRLLAPGHVHIPAPTYNEHAASFAQLGWTISDTQINADACVVVNPNNPDGRLWQASDLTGSLRIIDESFCDVAPQASLIAQATTPRTLILKSFGKFWGLAGLRLGFVIGDPDLIARLAVILGPWAVAGPALEIGAQALSDQNWAAQTRSRLAQDAARLDDVMEQTDAALVGGTTLFRLYDVPDAKALQTSLARHHIWTRVFPYNARWLRLGLPTDAGWGRLEAALK